MKDFRSQNLAVLGFGSFYMKVDTPIGLPEFLKSRKIPSIKEGIFPSFLGIL